MVVSNAVRIAGSPRLALVGMALLAVGAMMSYGNPDSTSVWVLVIPLALLAGNLLTAIIINPSIHRRGGLLVFHLGLLAIVLLAAVGRLTFFEAHIELLEGNPFSTEDLFDVRQGIWHNDSLDEVSFAQGRYTVNYSKGMVRGLTHSYVMIPGDDGGELEQAVVGDDRPLILNGYRFYTSFNKGFAPVLTWTPDNGNAITGAINMPSYPLFEHKQNNQWTLPNGEDIKFWLRLDTGLDEKKAWLLDSNKAKGVLIVTLENRRVELNPGESVVLNNGHLRYERLTAWMGYRVFYDPTIHWLFIASVLGVVGLFIHFWGKLGVRVVPEKLTPKALSEGAMVDRGVPVRRGL